MEKSEDKNLFKVVKQSGGEDIKLYGENMKLSGEFTRAANQSLKNCGKHVVGGGFNPNHPRELIEVYGNINQA